LTLPLQSSLAPFLRTLEMRSRLTDEERRVILELPFHPVHVAPNQDFIIRGEQTAHSCFVLEGFVGTFGQNRRGDRQITSVFVTGDMIDLMSVVVPECLWSAQALIATTILKVPHPALRQAAGEYPGIAEAFWRECVITSALLNEWVINVGRRDARSRLAHLFCELACRTGFHPDEQMFTFPFPITQFQLADMLGLTPVHVNRTLKGLREDRVVELAHRAVQILNWDRLVQIGEFESSYLQLRGGGSACQTTSPAEQPQLRMLQQGAAN
jgi:CRP-like cAMP-binding protein